MSSRFSSQLLMALCASIAMSLTVVADAQDSAGYVLRTYEVSDLTLTIRDLPYDDTTDMSSGGASAARVSRGGGGMGRGGGAFGGGGMDNGFSGQSGAAPVSVGSLMDVIITTVFPEAWGPQGRGATPGPARISSVGNSIVVWQSPAAHQQIEALLGALRDEATRRRTLAIDARWLLLTSDELDKLTQAGTQREGAIDARKLAEFTRRGSSIRGITHCFSGQLVYLVSGTRTNVVSGYIPVVGSADPKRNWAEWLAVGNQDGVQLVNEQPGAGMTWLTGNGVGYQPLVTTSNLGALLEIRPTQVRSGGDSVVVDLTSTITVPAKEPQEKGIGVGAPNIDRLAVETQRFATTLRMPLGQPQLIGGMTFFPPSDEKQKDQQQPASQEAAQLYLILEVK